MLAPCTGVLVTVTSNDCEAKRHSRRSRSHDVALPALIPCTKRSFEITLAEAMAGWSLVAENQRPAITELSQGSSTSADPTKVAQRG